jgi:hypothetical protein
MSDAWTCPRCAVTIQSWDMPHDHLCLATGCTTIVTAPDE